MKLFEEELPSLMLDLPIALRRDMFFQHDGCPAHYRRSVRAWLDDNYQNKWDWKRRTHSMAGEEPRFDTDGLYVWGHMKSLAIDQMMPIANIDILRQRIIDALSDMRRNLKTSVVKMPKCKSTSIMTPNKLFVRVPNNEQIRRKWLKLARRDDAHSLSLDSRMYFCEDHFDLSNDMINYLEYHIMGKVSRVCMKSDCIPTKFECQEDRRKRTSSSTERPYVLKKQRMMNIAECLKEYDESSIPSTSHKDTSNITSSNQLAEENMILCKTADKSVQASVTHKFRSKAVQVEVKYKDQGLSPLKPSLVSSVTSPFKVKTFQKSSLSTMGKIVKNIIIEGEHSDSDISLYTPDTKSHTFCTIIRN
ncbi:hypothetical protein evm_013113 [Chilo suppressalis]|nr:hypothetical protein evm_013113 [Chilo suppressalis]